jgi:hypothetical protein
MKRFAKSKGRRQGVLLPEYMDDGVSEAKRTGLVGQDVQVAVDAGHHLIVAHEVTNIGHDRTQLEPMAHKAREAMGCEELTVWADCGYHNGEQMLA